MKVLRRADGPQATARFAQEIEAIKSISDGRIVRIVDAAPSDPIAPYYVMPYYDGAKTLRNVLLDPQSPFRGDARESLSFIAHCADAVAIAHVAIAHAAGVIHRDLNPRNILVLPGKQPMIIDFGICLVLTAGHCITLVDEGVGAQNYMSPECESGAQGDIGPPSDVYSLGKLLWCMLTGRNAFARERPAFDNSRLSLVLPDRPECWNVTEILMMSIRHSPAERYKTAAGFAEACRRMRDMVIGRVLPMELLLYRCPQCGSDNTRDTLDQMEQPFHVKPRLLVGNPMIVNGGKQPGVTVRVCLRCGALSPRHTGPVSEYIKKLDEMERPH
jgi:serine/threonine protein kinase